MPIEDDKTTIESGAQPASEAASAPKKKGGMLVFAGIGVVAIVVGIALALFVIKPMMSDSGGSGDGSANVESKSDGHGKKSKAKGHGSEALIHEISNIVVNPAGTGGSRFLSASFGFELESAQLLQEFQQKEPVIRDALITILSSKTVAQLTDPKQKEIVRYQIRKRVSQIMNTESLAGVYYTDFVLQ
ncbi:MAG: flagellar basal body-associated FliL family protein [Candidatus Zixiibacteriota bacterium]|nr:MAG: flagellar basal body-associated FliL family protein [candidate division Zixibacteria bacterium]